jgi:hypothetical protein
VRHAGSNHGGQIQTLRRPLADGQELVLHPPTPELMSISFIRTRVTRAKECVESSYARLHAAIDLPRVQ